MATRLCLEHLYLPQSLPANCLSIFSIKFYCLFSGATWISLSITTDLKTIQISFLVENGWTLCITPCRDATTPPASTFQPKTGNPKWSSNHASSIICSKSTPLFGRRVACTGMTFYSKCIPQITVIFITQTWRFLVQELNGKPVLCTLSSKPLLSLVLLSVNPAYLLLQV